MPKSKSKFKPLLLYTLGDPAGIGPEVLIKALSKRKLFSQAIHIVIGDKAVLFKIKKKLSSPLKFDSMSTLDFGKIKEGLLNIVDMKNASEVKFGYPSKLSGRASLEYLELGIEIFRRHPEKFQALITLPVAKKFIQMNGISFRGHTDYFKQKFKINNVQMIFITDDFDLLLYTRHIPLREVVENIRDKGLIKAILMAVEFYHLRTGIPPKVAILGVNPHAGEFGSIGREEKQIIIPVIKKLEKKNIKIKGPFSADGFFRNLGKIDYQLVVSLYHDQALPVIKAFYKNAVNFTLGLPFLRFSPDHGTAFDIAGEGIADSSSLERAIEYALKFKCR